MKKRGKIFFISGPSGVGKGTLINALRKRHPEWVFPPSCTTRPPRPGEKDGETYYFISREAFEKKIKSGDFLEYAVVHGGHMYGTLKNRLIEPIKKGKIVIREFDVQGFASARKILNPEDFVSIFILPPDGLEALVNRIKKRAPISEQEIEKRKASMKRELKESKIYQHKIISEENKIEKLIEDAERIIKRETSGTTKD